MKTLYLCRHAKSSWSFDLEDFDRPLGARGRSDVLKVGRYLKDNIQKPDLIVTSPASRAFYTALFLADSWNYPEDRIELEPMLYHGSVESVVGFLGQQKVDSIAVFGHNPGFSELAYRLSGGKTEDMSTGSIIGLEFKMDSWIDLATSKGKPFLFIKPKSL